MATSSLLKTILHNSIAEGLYNEITNRTSRYYYFLGKTLSWGNEEVPPFPVDSYSYELGTRNEAITLKEIKPTDVSFVIPKYEWQDGVVYDMYDDQYSDEVQAIDLISGGNSFGSAPTVYIGSAGSTLWTASTVVFAGNFIKVANNGGYRYYIVTSGGTTNNVAPTHTDGTVANGTAQFKAVVVSDGGGSGATAVATVLDGAVIDVELTSRGTGYVSAPTVYLAGGGGVEAIAEAIVNIAPSGVQKLEDAIFYVVTDEYNVYKCLDNNNGAQSLYKPIGTTVDPISFPDGYLWKFLYNIPIALRTKFLTNEYMPVVTALRNQFYSNGNLQTIRVNNAGTGYTTGTISVQGDGFLSADPLYLTGITLESGGTGYSAATINIDPPFTNVSSWLANTSLFLGQKVNYNYNVYEVVIAGISGSSGPTHRLGSANNGTAALKYIGTQATATSVLSGGVITSVTLLGMLRTIDISDNGSGYTTVPSVNITGGSGSGATATAVLANGHIIKVIITDPGQNYTTAPTITFGTQWTASTAVTIGQQLYYSNRLYTVTVAGTTSSTAPSHLSGSATNGTATLVYAGHPAVANTSLKYGAGYSALPSVSIGSVSGSGASLYFSGVKSEARLIPIFASESTGKLWTASTAFTKGELVYYGQNVYSVVAAGTTSSAPPTHTVGIVTNGTTSLQYYSTFGQLIDVQIDDGGVGYTYATLTVNGDGSGAEITADLSPGDVNTLQANIELLTVDGRITAIKTDSGGWGYAAATITIEGDGVGAEATAIIENGYIKKINMTNYGSGYRWARVTISGNGFGAKARAIISPYGGHGKYTVNDLYARTLMFYTNISGDKNQGFEVNNDYRQLGILKNPRVYNGTNNLTSISASACWVISGNISTTFFPADSLIYESNTGKRFRIVTNTGSAILAQSLDNFEPVIGTTFVNDGNFTFSASAITPPNVDKYSGDLLFIDNKQAFTPTADQSVTLRTVIKF